MDSENSGAIFRIKNLALVRSPFLAVANKEGNSRSATKPQRDEIGPVSSQAAAVNQMFDEIYRATPMPSVILQQSNYNSKFWDQAYSSTQGFPMPGNYSGSIASTTSMHNSSFSYPYHQFGTHSLNSAGHSFDSTVLSEEDLNSSNAENISVGPDDEIVEVEPVVEEEPTSERHVHSHNDKILSSISAAQSETSANSTIASEPSTHNGRSKQRRKYVMDSLFQLTSKPLTPQTSSSSHKESSTQADKLNDKISSTKKTLDIASSSRNSIPSQSKRDNLIINGLHHENGWIKRGDDSLVEDEDDSEESDNSDLDVKSAEKKAGLSFISNLKQSRMLNERNDTKRYGSLILVPMTHVSSIQYSSDDEGTLFKSRKSSSGSKNNIKDNSSSSSGSSSNSSSCSNNDNNESSSSNSSNNNNSKRKNGRFIKKSEVSETLVDEVTETICQKFIGENHNNSSALSNEPIILKDSRRIDEKWSTDEVRMVLGFGYLVNDKNRDFIIFYY